MKIRQFQTDCFQCGYCCQLYYVLDGHGFLQRPDIYLSLRPGTIALVDAAAPYNMISYANETLYALHFCFDYTQTDPETELPVLPVSERKFSEKRAQGVVLPGDIVGAKGCLCLRNMQHLSVKLEQMQSVYLGDHRYKDALLSGQFKALLCDVFASAAEIYGKSEYVGDDGIVESLASYLDSHYMENITNADIAEHLNYHPNYLNKRMVGYTGKSLHQHLISYRIARATELLLFSCASVSAIAGSTGFGSAAHFSKAFLRYTGLSPSAMRALYGDSSRYASLALNTVVRLSRD